MAGPLEFGEISYLRKESAQPLNRAITILKEGGSLIDVASHEAEAFVRFSRGLTTYLGMRLPSHDRQPPTIQLFYGPTGSGKSYAARLGFMGEQLEFRRDYWSNPGGPIQWFDAYCGQYYAIFEEFCGAASHISLLHALALLDRYYMDVPIKGGFTLWWPRVIRLTTNIHPRKWYDYGDREHSYAALIRRFDTVNCWSSDGRRATLISNPGDRISSERDLEEDRLWQGFWRGNTFPRQLPAPRLGVEMVTLDPFDFIFNY